MLVVIEVIEIVFLAGSRLSVVVHVVVEKYVLANSHLSVVTVIER